MGEGTFGPWDYVVLGVMLVVSATIGIYYRFTGGKQKTTKEYLLGDGNLTVMPVSFSLMASFMSAITLLGVCTENYTYGTQFVVINLAYGIATPIAAYCFLPVFFNLHNTSVYEYLEQRFGSYTRLAASWAFSLQMVLYMGIVLYAPALALEAVTGLDKEIAILLVGAVCTFYSTIGGMKAVVVTDLFQSLLMFSAVYMVVIKGTIDAGGLGEVWRIAVDGYRVEFDSFDPDPTVRHTWWSLIIGGCFTYLSLYAVNQAQVQRMLGCRDVKEAQKALWISWPLLTLLSFSTSFSGLVIYANYYKCDPKTTGRISSPDQLMPLYVVETLGNIPGLAGLFTAGIFSGSLSSVSSALNSLAAVTLEDYLKPSYAFFKGSPLPEKHTGFISKVLALIFGLVCIAMAFIAQFLGGVLQASLTIFGVVGGPLFGVFTLGMVCTFCNEIGAISGLLTGLAVALWIGFGGPKPPIRSLPMRTDGCPAIGLLSNASRLTLLMGNSTTERPPDPTDEYFYLYRLSYMWYIVIGFFVTLVIGIVVSFICNLFRKTPQEPLNPDLFIPIIRNYLRKQGLYKTDEMGLGGNSVEFDKISGMREPTAACQNESYLPNGDSIESFRPFPDGDRIHSRYST